MFNREGLISRLSNYVKEEMGEYGSTVIYHILARALCEAITKATDDLDEFWLGHLSAQIYAVTTDGSGQGDDQFCHQIETEIGELIGVPPIGIASLGPQAV